MILNGMNKGIEVSPEQFVEILEVYGHVIDPFERYYNIGRDRTNGRRVIIKSYYINSMEQETAITENLFNYSALRKISGFCPIICYTKLSDQQIDVAFDFHQYTLQEYFTGVSEEAKDYYFFVKLLQGVVKALFELKNQEVEIDDIRASNILVDVFQDELVYRIFYDQRQKSKCLSFDKLYLSPERLEEWNSGNFGAYDFESKIVFECGLMLLDLLTRQSQESLYLNMSEINSKAIQRKLLILEEKYSNKQLPVLIAQMISFIPEQRPNLQEICHQCSAMNRAEVLVSQNQSQSQSRSRSIPQSGAKSGSRHSNFAQLSHYTNTKHRVFSDLDFLFVHQNTHQDVLQDLHKIKTKIDHLQFECKRYQDGSVYYGQLSGIIRQGAGIYTYANGDIFFGNWVNNAAMLGTYIFQSGQTYHGGVKNGKHGKGLYRYANGNSYDGYWQNDLKQGRGEMKYSNGDRYEGDWSKGKKHGHGIYQYNNGIKYEGNFVVGGKNGKCRITFPDKTYFQGNWGDSCVQGLGKMMYDNGDEYQGYYQESMKNGVGTFNWSNKVVYQGQFAQDSLVGKCIIHYPNKQIYEGTVVDGVKNGQGVYQYQNGDVFRGTWKNDQKLQGQYLFYDGSAFEGNFKNNSLFQGRMVYQNGDSYEGEFKYGQRDGIGKYMSVNGEIVKGEWRADSFLRTES